MTPTPEDIEVATLIEHVAWCPAHLDIRERDLVKVLQAYRFTTPDGGELQDITVQRANDHPIAVIHRLGDFERVEAKHPTEKP